MKNDTIPSSSSPEPGTLFTTATDVLLKPYALDAGALHKVLGGILSHKVDYADLYFQEVVG